jgi:hypothetical protein
MNQDTAPDLPRLSKVVDFKIPVTWLLGVAFMVAAAFVSMYFQLGSQGESLKGLNEQLKDLQITVKSGNGQAATIQGEIAILRFRVETLEADKRRTP